MRAARSLFVAVLAAFVASAPASAWVRPSARNQSARLLAPKALAAFLPADPPVTSFPRTPAFQWRPVRGAARYELILSTSSLFRSNGLIWDDSTLTTPVAAIPIALPWITGSSHTLYARVRAIDTGGVVGPWSPPYGFDMRWNGDGVPKPLPSPNGLIKWTPIDGATSYQVWYLNPPSTQSAPLNFSGNGALTLVPFDLTQDSTMSWTNTGPQMQVVNNPGGSTSTSVVNSTASSGQTFMSAGHYALQITSSGNWTIQITPNSVPPSTDIFSTPLNVADEREYFAPSSSWMGTVEWRVRAVREVYGALANGLPRVSYGPWSGTYTTPITPVASGTIGNLSTSADPTIAGSTPSGDTFYESTPGFVFDGNTGLAGSTHLYRVYVFSDQDCVNDVFDGVAVGSPAYAPRSAPQIPGQTTDGLNIEGDQVLARELQTPTTFTPTLISGTSPPSSQGSSGTGVTSGINNVKGSGAPIGLWDNNAADGSSDGRYYWTVVTVSDKHQDTELPQDVCNLPNTRRASFGVASEPVAVSDEASGTRSLQYAWGLSVSGSLRQATLKNETLYGTPLVGWAASREATLYEVQWSKSRYPGNPVGNLYTYSTSTTLPLRPGTWYYRARGINLFLPTSTAPQMAWSPWARIVIARPRFKIGH